MGLFDRDEETGSKNEVRVDVQESGSSSNKKETRLEKEVNSKVADGDTTNSNSSRVTSTSSSVSMEDIHDQNKRIIELLEQLTGEDTSSRETSSDDGMRGDMGELL